MNKKEFIKKLEELTGLDSNECIIINSILEDNFIIGKNNKEKIIENVMIQLSKTREESERLYETAMSIIGTGIKNKLKHPFKSQD